MKDDLMDVGVSSSLYCHREERETESYEQIGSRVRSTMDHVSSETHVRSRDSRSKRERSI